MFCFPWSALLRDVSQTSPFKGHLYYDIPVLFCHCVLLLRYTVGNVLDPDLLNAGAANENARADDGGCHVTRVPGWSWVLCCCCVLQQAAAPPPAAAPPKVSCTTSYQSGEEEEHTKNSESYITHTSTRVSEADDGHTVNWLGLTGLFQGLWARCVGEEV